MDGGAVRVHEGLAVRLLIVRELDHEHLALQPKLRTRKRQRRAPLARPGFCHNLFRALHLVVIGLGQCRVGLVRPAGAHAFVLVIDARRRVEVFFEVVGSEQWRGPVLEVLVSNLFGDLNKPVRRHFLGNQGLWKKGAKHLGADRFVGARMQRRQGFVGHVRHNVVVMGGELTLLQGEFVLSHGDQVLGRKMDEQKRPPDMGGLVISRGETCPWTGYGLNAIGYTRATCRM